jgi:hypothetical protein
MLVSELIGIIVTYFRHLEPTHLRNDDTPPSRDVRCGLVLGSLKLCMLLHR